MPAPTPPRRSAFAVWRWPKWVIGVVALARLFVNLLAVYPLLDSRMQFRRALVSDLRHSDKRNVYRINPLSTQPTPAPDKPK